MEVIIIDYRDGDALLMTIPDNIEDVESYLTEGGFMNSDCHYMCAEMEINICDVREGK